MGEDGIGEADNRCVLASAVTCLTVFCPPPPSPHTPLCLFSRCCDRGRQESLKLGWTGMWASGGQRYVLMHTVAILVSDLIPSALLSRDTGARPRDYGQKIMAADMCGCGNTASGVRSREFSLKSMAPGIKNRDAAAMPTKVCPLAYFFLIYSPILASTLVGRRSMAAGARPQAAVRSRPRVFAAMVICSQEYGHGSAPLTVPWKYRAIT